MRVLQLHTRYRQHGGEDAVVAAEMRALTAAGHYVQQHLAENPPQSLKAVAAFGAAVWNPRAASRVAKSVERVRPDVAHVHNTWFALSPAVLSPLRRRRVPIVMTVHNYRLACVNALFLRDGAPCEKCVIGSPLAAVKHRCYRDSAAQSSVAAAAVGLHRTLGTWSRLVDEFIVLSDFARQKLIQIGLPEPRIRVGANFVADMPARSKPPSASDEVLYVGRVSNEKGLRVLLEAWARLGSNRLRLTIVGDGPQRASLASLAPDGVAFAGHLAPADVHRRVLGARALVIPSVWYEGQPIAALEALAAGTPVVMSRIGGLPEVLGTRTAGWLSPPGDAGALATVLNGLEDDTDVDARAREARCRYLDVFTPRAGVVRLEDAYRSAMAART